MKPDNNEQTWTCDDCGGVFTDEEESTATDDGTTVCESCRDDEYVTLHDGRITNVANAAMCHIEEEWYDGDAGECCDDCDNWTADNQLRFAYVDGSRSTICSHCVQTGDYVIPEDDCEWHHIDGLYCDNDGYWWVECPADRTLHGYSTNVLDVIGRQVIVGHALRRESIANTKRPVMGVELELDTRDSYAEDIAATLISETDFGEFGICKEDGSVSGPELVTLPADLAAHRAMPWAEWCRILRPIARGHYGGGNGIHIHYNRRALSALALGKILVFMNSPRNLDFLTIIAQRDVATNQWCTPKADTKITEGRQFRSDERYSVVNVTPSTAEFRLFNASLMPDRILKNLEFVDAICTYCKNYASMQDAALHWSAFVDWLSTRRKIYPHLVDFINDRLDNMEERLCA